MRRVDVEAGSVLYNAFGATEQNPMNVMMKIHVWEPGESTSMTAPVILEPEVGLLHLVGGVSMIFDVRFSLLIRSPLGRVVGCACVNYFGEDGN